FLYDGERNLFRIGYRVDRGELDAGTYDLLASEARLASYVAICKRQVPMRHWFALGRPFVSVGGRTTLRSWSGSMFEYLMPSLVLDEPEAGMVHQALATAVDEQMRYGRARRLPWGVSESAYGAQDHTLAYQYSGFGVPTLALKRSAADDYVVAPYASALAAMLVPAAAVVNLRAIEDLNARQSCGFIDALDFTTRRRSRTEPFRLVRTFMAHHQGMTVVALCDVLAAHAPRRWFHASARVTAFEALLEERAPREVMLALPAPLAGHGTDLVPAVEFAQSLDDEETREGLHAHALSNGRYSVLVFADGAGWSRRGSIALTRWRDDALRHVGGSFVFVRETQGGTVRGLAASPPMKGATTYRSTFLADRVVSEVRCAAYEATLTVLVSPEDDVEMRDVALRDAADEPLDVEFVSYLEPVLATQAAEDAHPAFSNLFVGVRFDPSHGVLMFERRPRNERETAAHLAHFVVPIEGDIGPVEAEVDRRHFIGRGRTLSSAAALARAGHREDGATPGLDPVASLRVRVRVPPRGRTRVLFATAAGDTPETLWGHVDKYRTPANLERASLMSATLADIRLRELGIGAPEFGALLRLTPLVAQTMPAGARPGGSFQRRYLWRHGISGDRPIVVVAIGAVVGLGLLRAVMRAREFWQFAGIVVDVVVLNGESQSYIEPVGSAIGALVATAAMEAEVENQQPAVFVLRRDALTDDEHRALAAQARVVLEADGRPFEHHVNEVVARRHAARSRNTEAANGDALPAPVASRAGGDFDVADGAYVFEVDPKRPPARPWVNVIANPHFGFQVSETGAGFTWAGNSRLHQLTSWSNDPVLDSASEWLVLEDVADRRCYALLGGQPPDARVPMQVRHGFGHSTFETRIGDLDVEATVFAAPEDSVKWTVLRLRNTGRATRRVRVLATAEWTLGATRSERRYVAVRKHPGAPCIFATRTEHGDAWAGGAAFLAACADNAEWTGDRREFYPTRGVVDVPATLLGAEGSGLDACAALRVARSVAPGAAVAIAFALGYAPDEAQAEALAQQCLDDDALAVLDRVRAAWRSRLGALRVETPDPRFDALVNGWLPYQAIACRLWARAGFYQVGGAYGFRDQLQDAMGVALLDPSLLRRQLLLHASRQFREGDVQHWWHPPTGAGVRTRFSDDRLWLPYACLRYLDVTTDAGVLDESVPFLEGEAVPDGAEDAYYVPTISDARASLFEHCARAIDASLATGAHGLPLMGGG
ncbi:MAG: glucoamylase family protein, partial [Betaproteobacteria bacterium]